jgi:hypothetical protein
MQNTKIQQSFVRAVEEAKEIQDRRDGVTPATNYDPLDFLVDKIEYDDTQVENMAFDERFPPLSADEAKSMTPAEAIALVRQYARNPSSFPQPPPGKLPTADQQRAVDAYKVAERMIAWSRFALAPLAVQQKLRKHFSSMFVCCLLCYLN